MGVASDIAKRIAGFFSKDKERVNLQLAKGSTSERLDGSAVDLLTGLGYDALSQYLRLDQDILNRYADYEEMDDYGEIATALDILADDATQPDSSIHRTVWVTAPDKTLQQNLDDLLNRTLRLDEEIWEIARTLCKYGNDFEEILVTKEGVRGLNYLPPATVRRVESKKGDLLGFIQDFKGTFDYSVNDFQQVLSGKFGNEGFGSDIDLLQNPIAAFEGWEVVHFRLHGKERRSLYGHSALESARWIWKRLMLLEDAALVYRLQRAPERFAFYVDVGDLPPKEALAFVNRVRQNFRKKKFVDPTSGKLNLKFDALPVAHDTPIPLLDGRTITIAEMAREHEQGIKHWVYSIDRATGNPVPGEVQWVGQTRTCADAVRVKFDDGGVAVMAPDHPVMLRDRTYVLAGELEAGDSVMPFYRKLGEGRLEGYEHWYNPETHKYSPTHRIVSDATVGALPKGSVVHHKNFDKRNNTPDNLVQMLWEDHMALHKHLGHTGGRAVSELRKIDAVVDARLREASRRNITAYNRSELHRALTSARNLANDSGRHIRAYNGSTQHSRDNATRSAAMSAFWRDPAKSKSTSAKMRVAFPRDFVVAIQNEIRLNPSITANNLVAKANAPEMLSLIQAANSRKIGSVHRHMLLKMYRNEGSDSFADYKAATLHPTNHKVVSVERVDPCDHYCMTVKDWHNFALSLRDSNGNVLFGSGVFVKNSQDEDFFVPSRKGTDSTRIETLGAPQWQAMDDIEYFRDKLFAAIKVPKAYLGQEQGVARAVLSSEDVRFARTVLRIQRELKNGLRKLIRVHLSALDIDPYEVDYDIHMTVPSAIFELAQMEVRTAKADLAGRMRDFVSMHWIMSRVFGLSDDEIKEIQQQRKDEAISDAKTQADAMAAAQPPMPEMGTEPAAEPSSEPPPEGEEPAGPYGPPPEESRSSLSVKKNLLERKLHRQRTRAFRRGIPTQGYISDTELFEGKQSPEKERALEDRLQKILQNDAAMAIRLQEVGSLLKEIRFSSSRKRN